MNDDASQRSPLPEHLTLIGCGQMGSAIARRLLTATEMIVELCDRDERKVKALLEVSDRARALSFKNLEADGEGGARLILVAVKPHHVQALLEGLALKPGDCVISVAAGVELARLREWVASPAIDLVRAMPNTPVEFGAGVTGLLASSPEALQRAKALFAPLGEVVELKEEGAFHGLTAISGSGPAYMFVILEALADAGVLAGLDRLTSRRLALATMRGASVLAERSGAHTAELKDRVASPAGTTIAGLRELERHGLREALISAVEAAAKRSASMG